MEQVGTKVFGSGKKLSKILSTHKIEWFSRIFDELTQAVFSLLVIRSIFSFLVMDTLKSLEQSTEFSCGVSELVVGVGQENDNTHE